MLDNHHHGGAHLSVWLPAPPGVQQALVEEDVERFFRPPYVGTSGWVGVVLDTKPDWAMVAALVEGAYRQVAHRRLVAQLPAPGRTASGERRKLRPRNVRVYAAQDPIGGRRRGSSERRAGRPPTVGGGSPRPSHGNPADHR